MRELNFSKLDKLLSRVIVVTSILLFVFFVASFLDYSRHMETCQGMRDARVSQGKCYSLWHKETRKKSNKTFNLLVVSILLPVTYYSVRKAFYYVTDEV